MLTITFTIPEDPLPKQRARTFNARRKDGSVVMQNGKPVMKTRTPGQTKAWQKCIAAYARKAAAQDGLDLVSPYAGPVELGCLFFCHIPKGWSLSDKTAAVAGEKEHTSDPDLSNLLKTVEDACEGILYVNDKQIVRYVSVDGMPTGKYYASSKPHVVVLVRCCDEEKPTCRSRDSSHPL